MASEFNNSGQSPEHPKPDPYELRTDPAAVKLVFEDAPLYWQVKYDTTDVDPTYEAVSQLKNAMTAICDDESAESYDNGVRFRPLPLPFRHKRWINRRIERRYTGDNMVVFVNPSGLQPQDTGVWDNEDLGTQAAVLWNYRGVLTSSEPLHVRAFEALYITHEGQPMTWRRIIFDWGSAVNSGFPGLTAARPSTAAEVEEAMSNLTASVMKEDSNGHARA